jgi:hypothetical protein
MGRQAGPWTILLVVGSSLLWVLLMTGIVTGPVQETQLSPAVSVQRVATVSPQVTLTRSRSAQPGKTAQNEQVPSWVTLSLLLIGVAVLLAALGLLLWIGGLLPWRRQRQPAGWHYEVLLAGLAGLAAFLALAPQVFAVFTPPLWVRIALIVLAGVLALAAAIVKLRSTQLEKARGWARQVRGLLNLNLGTDGLLPRLSTLNLYRLGISPSRYGSEDQRGDDPYVARVIDEKLDQALASKRFVLVVGDSKAGKSRTAYEAAIRLQYAGRSHDPRVLVPKSTDVLGQLLDLDPPLDLHPEPALLWLDDLSESELEALTPALLDRLMGPMLVLGTLTAQRHDRVMETGSDISRDARLALQRAEVIRLDASLTDQERMKAEQKYPKER